MRKTIRILWVLMGLFFLFSLYQLKNLRTEYSVDQFYPKSHSLLHQNDEIGHVFRLNQEQPYLIAVEFQEKDAWLRPERITRLKQITNHFQERDDVEQVVTMTHIEGASLSSDEMVIGNIFSRIPHEEWKNVILKNALLYPLLVTQDFKATLIIIESSLKDRKNLEKFHNETLETIQNAFPDARLHTAGVPLLQTRLSGIIESELSLFLVFILIGFCIIFYFLFSHWTAIVFALGTLIVSNVFGLALMATFNISINAILVTLPVIISVSIMSLLIHGLHLWAGKNIGQLSYNERVSMAKDTLMEIGVPNALGILTTALGFLTLAPSAIPLISQYGFTVSLILSLVSILAQLLIFLSLPLVTPQVRSWPNRPAYWALVPLHHSGKISLVTILFAISGFLLLPHLNFSFRLFDDLPESDPIRTTTNWIDSSFGGIVTYDVQAKSIQEDFWKKPINLRKLQALSKELREIKAIRTVVTVTDLFQGKIPEKKTQISETFFLFSIAEKNPLNSFMTENGKSLRIAIRLSDIPGSSLDMAKQNIREKLQEAFPELQFTFGGMASYAHAINQAVAKELIFNFGQP